MTIAAMDGKPASDPPATVTVIEQSDGKEKKSRDTRKYVITAVTCVVVAAVVIAGILIGVKFFLDSTNDIVKKTYRLSTQEGEKAEEDVEISVNGNFVQYHVNDEDTEVWVVEDFNRDVQVMKVRRPEFGIICFVAKLNRSDTSLPRALLDDNNKDDEVETENGNYQLSERPVQDMSVLGTQGQKLCSNIDVYWMTPLSAAHTRQKREETAHKPTGYCKAKYCYYKKKCFIFCWWSKKCYWYHNKCKTVCDRVL